MTDEDLMAQAELLNRLRRGWDEFNAYLNTLTEEQLTGPTDAAGWTAKDHIMHLVVWADNVNALLEGKSRHEYMGIDKETWERGDWDYVNAIIQQRYRDIPLEEVLKSFRDVHERLVEKIQGLTDGDLQRPYHYYQPELPQERPVIAWIIVNSYDHYAQHIPWIDAIVRGSEQGTQ